MKGGSQDVLGIPGCPRDPLDSMGSCVRGTPREDPGMSKGFSEQHGQLVERDMKGGSLDVLGILDPPKTERTRLDCLRSLGQL